MLLLRLADVHSSNDFLHSGDYSTKLQMQLLIWRSFERALKSLMLSSLSTLPGLQHAFLTDVHGHVLASCGGDLAQSYTAIAAVLVQALVAAAEEIGNRSTLGAFTELHSTYQIGGVFVQASANASLLLVIVHDLGADLHPFREHGQEVLASEVSRVASPRPPSPAKSMPSLMDALAANEPS